MRVRPSAEYWAERQRAEVPPPRQLDAPTAAVRELACATCEHRDADRCRLMGCGCSLRQRQLSPWASCPASRWPSR